MKAIKKTINNLLICLFLLCASGMHAQTINWGTGVNIPFASDINVGSSENSFIEFYFYATGSSISQGIVEVVLPYTDEVFDLTQITQRGNVNLGTPSASGQILKFSATDIAAGQVVHYRIPRYSKTQSDVVRTGNAHAVTINIYKGNSTLPANRVDTKNDLTYSYKYAKIQFNDPSSMPLNQSSGLEMNFGNNNAVHDEANYAPQTFRFELYADGGATDSVSISLTFPIGGVTLSNWRTGESGSQKNIPASQTVTTATAAAPYTTTCTVKIRKSDFPTGKGIAENESVPVFVDVAKNTCGTADVVYASTWATQTTIRNLTNASTTGSFVAAGGNGLLPNIKLVPNSPNGGYAPGETACQDNSFHEYTYAITNSGDGQARNIRATCAIANASNHIDTSTIRVKKGYNGEWMKPERILVTESVLYTSNLSYRGKPMSASIDIKQHLAPGLLDTLYISYQYSIPADSYLFHDASNSIYLPRFTNWIRYYSDACGTPALSSDISLGQYYISPETSSPYGRMGIIAYETTPINFLEPNAVDTFSLEQVAFRLFDSSVLSSSSAKAIFRIALPKGVQLKTETANDIKACMYGQSSNVWPVKDFSFEQSGDSTVYTFALYKTDKPSTAAVDYSIDIILKNTCSENLNQTAEGDIRMFVYPTGVAGTSNCSDVVYDWIGVKAKFSLHCMEEGVTYKYDLKRMTVGWNDDDNNAQPDFGATPADPEKITHSYIFPNDTLQFTWKAKVLEEGDTVLYAVFLTRMAEYYLSVNSLSKSLTLNGVDGLLRDSLINSASAGTVLPRDRGAGFPLERYAYIWEITRKDGKPFLINDSVAFTIELNCTVNTIFNASRDANSWFYASKTSRIKGIAALNARLDSVLVPGDARRGREEYPFSFYVSTPVLDLSGSNITYSFTGVQEKMNNVSLFAFGSSSQTYPPFEYRHLTTLDSVVFQLPEGYEFPTNSATFRIIYRNQSGGTGYMLKDTTLVASQTHANTPVRKTFVFGSSVFDVNRDGSTGFPLPNGAYSVQAVNLKISSTPSSPIGLNRETVFQCHVDNHSYTQANIPDLGLLFTQNDNIRLLITELDRLLAISAGNTVQAALSSAVSWRISLQNTRTSGDACGGWLYVQGPVQNTKLIRQGGAVYTGIGDGGRWIPLPDIAPGVPLTDTLVVEYTGNDCNSQTVTVYPIFDPAAQTGTGWNPYTNGGIEMTDTGFLTAQQTSMSGAKKYIYPKLTLTIQNVESRLSGYIKPLPATPVNPAAPETGDYTDNEIFIDKNFPVEIAFSTFGAQGSVVNTTAQLRVPAGLQYVPDSTYIEVNDVNYKVTGSALIAELQKLDGSADKIITLRLSDAGIAALESNGQIPGNDTTYLRLKLKPTCDIGFSTPRIGVIFNGERICGASIITSNREYYSSWLTLGGKSSALNMVMENPTVSVSDFMCNTTAEAVLKFKNQTGPNVSVVISDSLRLVVPKAIDLESGATPVSYNLPTATDYPSGLQGTIPVEDISNRVIGDFRYLTWPMPKTYFDNLA
ncbi:MAG: hypothetical protein LBM08_10840, partial [Dysgonamonadaceae bacterium]|nr:hypothetical protein [Dysgonamonadaceae bacterium]